MSQRSARLYHLQSKLDCKAAVVLRDIITNGTKRRQATLNIPHASRLAQDVPGLQPAATNSSLDTRHHAQPLVSFEPSDAVERVLRELVFLHNPIHPLTLFRRQLSRVCQCLFHRSLLPPPASLIAGTVGHISGQYSLRLCGATVRTRTMEVTADLMLYLFLQSGIVILQHHQGVVTFALEDCQSKTTTCRTAKLVRVSKQRSGV